VWVSYSSLLKQLLGDGILCGSVSLIAILHRQRICISQRADLMNRVITMAPMRLLYSYIGVTEHQECTSPPIFLHPSLHRIYSCTGKERISLHNVLPSHSPNRRKSARISTDQDVEKNNTESSSENTESNQSALTSRVSWFPRSR
jgi:hypothetical protein